MGILLFVTSLFFNALQPISQALTADIAPPISGSRLWNVEPHWRDGAVMSPMVSGALRDATGNWSAAVVLDGTLIFRQFCFDTLR